MKAYQYLYYFPLLQCRNGGVQLRALLLAALTLTLTLTQHLADDISAELKFTLTAIAEVDLNELKKIIIA